MTLIDANLLLYAAIRSFPEHDTARAWLDSRLNGTVKVGLPWPSVLAFVRLASNRRVFARPLRVAEAWAQATTWLNLETVWMPAPTDEHPKILGAVLADVGNDAELVPDAHLAALAIEHGLTLMSAGRDFARFRGLTWENPLSSRSLYREV